MSYQLQQEIFILIGHQFGTPDLISSIQGTWVRRHSPNSRFGYRAIDKNGYSTIEPSHAVALHCFLDTVPRAIILLLRPGFLIKLQLSFDVLSREGDADFDASGETTYSRQSTREDRMDWASGCLRKLDFEPRYHRSPSPKYRHDNAWTSA